MSSSALKKGSIAFSLALLLALSAITLATVPEASAASNIYFAGYVYYADGTSPAGGVTVKIDYPADSGYSITATTDSSGYYITGPYALSGTVVNRYAMNERASSGIMTDTFSYSPDIHVNRDITMPPDAATAGFMGRVTYNGNPATGAAVHYEYGGYYGDYSCDSDGNYAFGGYFYGGSALVRVTYNGVTSEFTSTPEPFITVTHDFALTEPLAHLNGYVTHDGVPVSGAMVTIAYGSHSYTMGTDGSGNYNIALPYDGSMVTVWATYTGLHSPEPTYTPASGESFRLDIAMTDSVPSSTPTPAGIITIYAITQINGTPADGVQVTCQYRGLTQTQTSAYMDIEDTSCGASYHGSGAARFVFTSAGEGTAVLHATKEGYEGSRTIPITITPESSFSCDMNIDLAPVAATSGGATATPTATPGLAPNATATPAANGTSTGAGMGTNATITPSPEPATGTTATPVDGASGSSSGCCGATLLFLLASVLCPVLVLVKGLKGR